MNADTPVSQAQHRENRPTTGISLASSGSYRYRQGGPILSWRQQFSADGMMLPGDHLRTLTNLDLERLLQWTSHNGGFSMPVSQAGIPAEYLYVAWRQMWRTIGARGDGVALFGGVLGRYSEARRRYHTCQHLQECFLAYEGVMQLCERPGEVAAALWFHDAVYDLETDDSEQRSAQLAYLALKGAGVAEDAARRVHGLVLATTHVGLPGRGDDQVVVDIDLSILGASSDRFLESEAQLRDE